MEQISQVEPCTKPPLQQIQILLRIHNFYAGPVDGQDSDQIKQAINTFVHNRNEAFPQKPLTGEQNTQLLSALYLYKNECVADLRDLKTSLSLPQLLGNFLLGTQESLRQKANQKVYLQTIEHSGITYDENALVPLSWPYYAVSVYPTQTLQIPLASFTVHDVERYLSTYKTLLDKPLHHLGLRVDQGVVRLDISVCVPKGDDDIGRQKALSLAAQAHQAAIYDLENFVTIAASE